MSQLAGSSKSRQLIVDTALEYLSRISVDVRMQPDMALELATAHMRVARVQGVNISPNLGLTREAAQTADKAQQLINEVLRAAPNNRVAMLRAGQIAHDRMILAGDAHRDSDAIRLAHKAMEHLDRYLEEGIPADREEAQQAIIALMNVANRYVLAGEFDEGIGIARRAIAVAQATRWPELAGAALMVVAFAQRGRGNLNEALEAIRESVRLLEPEPGDHRSGRLQPYSLALMREGQILGEPEGISLGRPLEALHVLERSLSIGEDFARRDAGDYQSQWRVFSAETRIAAIVRDREPARALRLYDDALQRLAAVEGNGGTLRNEAMTLAECVYPLLRLGAPGGPKASGCGLRPAEQNGRIQGRPGRAGLGGTRGSPSARRARSPRRRFLGRGRYISGSHPYAGCRSPAVRRFAAGCRCTLLRLKGLSAPVGPCGQAGRSCVA